MPTSTDSPKLPYFAIALVIIAAKLAQIERNTKLISKIMPSYVDRDAFLRRQRCLPRLKGDMLYWGKALSPQG